MVCGKKVLLRTRDLASARAFQNGLGWPDAKVVAVRLVWGAPLARANAFSKSPGAIENRSTLRERKMQPT